MPEFVRPKSIGGYFDLELPRENTSYMHENAFYYQSARAAFRSLLQAGKPQRVWLPKYICDAMLSPLLDEGIEHVWYDLDENLKVSDSIVLGEGDWILYVNYFGVCQNQIDDLLNRFPANEIIFDYSQAFFDIDADFCRRVRLVCMYVGVYVCMYVLCMYVCMCVCMYARIHVYV